MKQLESSLDWREIELEIRELSKTAPEFKFDVIKFCAGISSQVRKLSEVEIEIRRRPMDHHKQKHKKMCADINSAIKDFSQTHLLHLFTRVD